MPNILVVGAGPAGCTAALGAARLPGTHVRVLEKRSLESLVNVSSSTRSYPMVLSGRATTVFEGLGLDLPSTRTPYRGIMFLPGQNTMKFADPQHSALVSRTQLAVNLLQEVARAPNVSVHFSASPASIDFDAQRLYLEGGSLDVHDCSDEVLQHLPDVDNKFVQAHALRRHASTIAAHRVRLDEEHEADGHVMVADSDVDIMPSSNVAAGWATALAMQSTQDMSSAHPTSLQFDLLIGADGSNSKVRQLAAEAGLLTCTERYRSQSAYKTFSDVRIPSGQHESSCPYAATDVKPSENLYFVPSQDRSSESKVVMWRNDRDHLCGMVPGAADDRTEDQAYLASAFGDQLPAWLREQLAEQLCAQQPSPFGSIVTCSALHAPGGIVLLGDSGHAVTSTLGQGCNMAIESVAVFHDILRSCLCDKAMPLSEVPAAYTAARGRDVWSMQHLEHFSAVLQRKLPAGTPLPVKVHAVVGLGSAFLLGTIQWRLQPDRHQTLPIFRMLYDCNTPYSDVLAYVNRVAVAPYALLVAIVASVVVNLQSVL